MNGNVAGMVAFTWLTLAALAVVPLVWRRVWPLWLWAVLASVFWLMDRSATFSFAQVVDNVKKAFETEVIPTVNMWCAHTLRLTNMIATEAATIAG